MPPKRKPPQKAHSKATPKQPPRLSQDSGDRNGRLEFHRRGLALLPDPGDRRPGVALVIQNADGDEIYRHCTCRLFTRKTCHHLLELSDMVGQWRQNTPSWDPYTVFRNGIWHRLAAILAAETKIALRSVGLTVATADGQRTVKIDDPAGGRLLTYPVRGSGTDRFIERCGQLPGDTLPPHRGAVLKRLSRLTLSETEHTLKAHGMKSRRQALEESFWYRFAYHGFREFGPDGCSFHPAVDETNGRFVVTGRKKADASTLFHLTVPRNRVRAMLHGLGADLPNQNQMPIHPIPLKSIFRITQDTQLDLDVRPMVKLMQQAGEARFFDREDLEKFRYGDLVYLKDLGIMAELESPGNSRKYLAPVRMKFQKYQVPRFIASLGDDFDTESFQLDPGATGLQILKQSEAVEIVADAIDRDWCWLSVDYGFGESKVSLTEILKAREEGQRYISTADGWVDCQAAGLEALGTLWPAGVPKEVVKRGNSVRFSRLDLLRLHAMAETDVAVTGNEKKAGMVRNLLAFKPPEPLPDIGAWTSPLRAYQRVGLEWICFLYENGFGGLLCDDMGLGKTHQVMAFMVLLKHVKGVRAPFLVVCPTSVISHWKQKMARHAPGLKTVVFHGVRPSVADALTEAQVLITSFGILRRDIQALKRQPFALAVFDEVQYVKNRNTQAYAAAQLIDAGMKLALTGTPIENSLVDLKALMDLIVAGYLGPEKRFKDRYVTPIEERGDPARQRELSRLVAPFTLRRMKLNVLHELPPKIEDVRTCRLSEQQVKLYRDAVDRRGRKLLAVLLNEDDRVPYMHVFALLTLLKQICNHPALLEDRIDGYDAFVSGKWDLFTELLDEALTSGQKVVVYSQFLGMIAIIADYLARKGIDFVTLTGSSRNRGRIVARFNEDPACRVFVGSLKAGGVGIDLVAASVVIHYDRWWNAAREDQATDRVHRIGQRRGVQVFKLVCEGTLEEKIAAIIEKKRNLMQGIVKEDDPGLLKAFTRRDLANLLTLTIP